MNKQIRTMAVGCLLLFLALLLNATYLQYVNAGDLNDRNDNRRVRDSEFSRERGAILVGGKAVAESTKSDDRFEFQRRYLQPFKYAHLTGFFSYVYGASAVELSQNDILSGSDPRLFVNRVVDTLSNTPPKGGSVTLTIDPAAQTAAFDGIQALGGDVSVESAPGAGSTHSAPASVAAPTFSAGAPTATPSRSAAKLSPNLSLGSARSGTPSEFWLNTTGLDTFKSAVMV